MLQDTISDIKQQIHDIEISANQLEHGSPDSILENQLTARLSEIGCQLVELDQLVLLEPKARRDDFRRRVQHLKSSYFHIKASFEHGLRRMNVGVLNAQKEKLFEGANSANYSSDISLEMAESGSLSRSSLKMNEYLAVGQETLSELLSQRDRLKSIQRKVFDILGYLGVSSSLMRAVERRDYVDQIIVYGGMILITLLLVFVWLYYR
jgi:Golgi SNAP receptor complex protein 2